MSDTAAASEFGPLYLLPTPLGPGTPRDVLPEGVLARVRSLRYFIAERPRSARAFLRSVDFPCPLTQVRIATLDEHTPDEALPELLAPLAGAAGALLSEAGAPGVADPGAALVRLAHARGIRVAPLVGPSAILLALMAAGLNGQHFAFHGYLPIEAQALARRVRELEAESRRLGQTQVFIETPYRNDRLLEVLLRECRPATRIAIASDLTLASESIGVREVAAWRRAAPRIGKRPAVFLLLALAEGR
ncbi:MAG: SAM-dependent methyltransferase [Burkholderiales bacterium]|nr:SAM-dependent methyltransferase [Burkholderiales bacterium]